jgi:iron complex outermembrane receptor protein
LNLNPSFFKNYLKVNVNAKYLNELNHFADNGAIGSAIAMDPTKPVYADNLYGGYWAWLQADGTPVGQATSNPVALLKLRDDNAQVNRFLGNLQMDYKLHFLPDLRVVLNLGIDVSKSSGTVWVPEYASWVYTNKGTDNTYGQKKNNKVLDIYLNYVKEVKSIRSKFDLMGGYSWQHFYFEANNHNSNIPHDPDRTSDVTAKREYYLLSFYGRFNYTLANRYLLTVTVRDDGSSKF